MIGALFFLIKYGEAPVCDLCAETFATPKNAEEAPTDRSSSIWRLVLSSVRRTLLPKRPSQEVSHQKTC